MLDQARPEESANLDRHRKAELKQFMTPPPVARFMASLFSAAAPREARLLDAGAGRGGLCEAFLDRWISGGFAFQRVEVAAFEIDDTLRSQLVHVLEGFAARLPVDGQVFGNDFIEQAVNQLQFQTGRRFTHAILNPPYGKIGSHSRHRLLLRQAGIETVNLYSAFVALATALMEPGGQLVAIVPRSFCNGPYYRPFRAFMLERAAIRHMHLFTARDKIFRDDGVLQENMILLVERGGRQGDVVVSTSTDDSLADLAAHAHPFGRIVLPDDPEKFIHIPASRERGVIEQSTAFGHSLAEIGVEVSTGPVVDFRLREHLRGMPEPGTVPLLYPGHFAGPSVEWPKPGWKKPNALVLNPETRKWLYPNGFYAVARRFSAKEERRRIVANLVSPQAFDTDCLGFENHLNVLHRDKRGLPEDIARGLVTYLNATAVDEYFRRFSGHTQVNAADLRLMRYPSHEALAVLGKWARKQGGATQEQIDRKIESMA